MQLQGRELSTDAQGADVSLLQFELGMLFEIPEEEVVENFFGEGTQKAVERFQEESDLKITGVVDEATAECINKVVGYVNHDQVCLALQVDEVLMKLFAYRTIECGEWLIHQQHVRIHCHRARNRYSLLLSTR